jgi:hypothetical protein
MHRRRALGILAAGFLRAVPLPALATPSDRKAFRAWFAWLAEALYYTPEVRRPREVSDCSALLRFAYREALRPHTAEWARNLGLDWMPPLPELSRASQHSALFRTASGESREFADAENLMRHNTYLVARDTRAALRGDLLFYRQLVSTQRWHSMVHLGPSAFERSREARVIYHTGPTAGERGELRRPTLAELLNHPEPRWRPVAGNGNFLGVFRWNILRETD